MDIEALKKEFKKMRAPKMDISTDVENNLNKFISTIKMQDKEDEKYILHNKMIPVLFGLFFIVLIILFNPIKSPLMSIGHFLIFAGFFSTLILLFADYRKISKESFDFSLLSYLKQKKDRLESWRNTSIKYYLTFSTFLTGLILSNLTLLKNYSFEFSIFLLCSYLTILVIAWIIGEYFYKKRHRKKHLPIIKILSEQIKELNKE